jgi:ParB-like chromosome segregation protein Spo0J
VIAGRGRVLACRELGWTEVPTIRLDHLDEAQKRAFMIADNRLTEISQWDDKLLAEQLRELSLLDLEFSLDATGFEIAEIDRQMPSRPSMMGRPSVPAGIFGCSDGTASSVGIRPMP